MHIENSEAIAILKTFTIAGNGLQAARLKAALALAINALGEPIQSRDMTKPQYLACQDCGFKNLVNKATCAACGSTNLRPGPAFVQIDIKVMQGQERACTARSVTMAKRIANALNNYMTDARGR